MCICRINQLLCKNHASFALENLPRSPEIPSGEVWYLSSRIEVIFEENWDFDDCYTYKPSILERNVIRTPPIGKSKAQKRAFRVAERQRHENLSKVLGGPNCA